MVVLVDWYRYEVAIEYVGFPRPFTDGVVPIVFVLCVQVRGKHPDRRSCVDGSFGHEAQILGNYHLTTSLA